jgi:anti-anti-sigma regulatory factor
MITPITPFFTSAPTSQTPTAQTPTAETTASSTVNSARPSINPANLAIAPGNQTPGNPIRPPGLPRTLVLQPAGNLTEQAAAQFAQTLKSALERVSELVIVDLLWVEVADAQGIAAMLQGLNWAAAAGKTLSFQAMHIRIRVALEAEIKLIKDRQFGQWSDYFSPSLCRFLEEHAQAQYGVKI